MLQLELVKLLLTVHLDNQGHHEHEKCGPDDPGGFSGALEEFFSNEGGIRRRFPALIDDRRFGDAREDSTGRHCKTEEGGVSF